MASPIPSAVPPTVALKIAKLAVRNRGGSNHHIWNNNGTWFVHFTIHTDGYQKRRVRRSLHTRVEEEARMKRDALFTTIQRRMDRLSHIQPITNDN